ncbi:tryptophan halogenase family protein [Brevundimonas sp.]|uniref:tryptophan halogenase family protein n=1 Tax=Brevundimonas sp. TaxID=1871086 RepID=UPI002D6F0FB3|nr:tryptophan halogenase family protein [Brevundimonas sp.]HYC98673.1 tryptophan halogenase family protein [Brevundimonas sp.]
MSDAARTNAGPGRAEPIRRIVIVGGGTAGWMAAAAFSKQLADLPTTITLVESDDIGTVGVGEATIPAIHAFNAMLGIDQAEFMRFCNGTFKLGIEFVDWGRLGSSYIHPFTSFGRDFRHLSFYQMWLKYSRLMAVHGGTALPFDNYNVCAVAAYKRRFAHPEAGAGGPVAPLRYAFHFDASRYAKYLRGFAEKRGVTRVEGKITDVQQDSRTGFITSVQLQDGQVVPGDLFIDCSGFRGLLIEQTLHSGYEEWTHWLPCNRAVAVPSETVEPPVPYTRSTADAAGWRWRIPLQNRVGNGYVYSSDFITDDQAQEQILRTIDGEPLAEPRRLSFVTGKRRQFWNRNCVAIGLASGFLEPLESTSIHLIQTAILKLLAFFPDSDFSPADRDAYNRHTSDEYDFIRDFIILHYKATERGDTPFWRQCRDMDVPDTLAAKMDLFRSRGRMLISNDDLFKTPSWEVVMDGQGLSPRSYDPIVDTIPDDDLVAEVETAYRDIQSAVQRLPSHQDYIARFCRAEVQP